MYIIVLVLAALLCITASAQSHNTSSTGRRSTFSGPSLKKTPSADLVQLSASLSRSIAARTSATGTFLTQSASFARPDFHIDAVTATCLTEVYVIATLCERDERRAEATPIGTLIKGNSASTTPLSTAIQARSLTEGCQLVFTTTSACHIGVHALPTPETTKAVVETVIEVPDPDTTDVERLTTKTATPSVGVSVLNPTSGPDKPVIAFFIEPKVIDKIEELGAKYCTGKKRQSCTPGPQANVLVDEIEHLLGGVVEASDEVLGYAQAALASYGIQTSNIATLQGLIVSTIASTLAISLYLHGVKAMAKANYFTSDSFKAAANDYVPQDKGIIKTATKDDKTTTTFETSSSTTLIPPATLAGPPEHLAFHAINSALNSVQPEYMSQYFETYSRLVATSYDYFATTTTTLTPTATSCTTFTGPNHVATTSCIVKNKTLMETIGTTVGCTTNDKHETVCGGQTVKSITLSTTSTSLKPLSTSCSTLTPDDGPKLTHCFSFYKTSTTAYATATEECITNAKHETLCLR